MRFWRAFLPTTVLRIAQETTALRAIRIVAAKTRYEPQAMCGMNRSTSIRNASRVTRKVMSMRMKRTRRYLAE